MYPWYRDSVSGQLAGVGVGQFCSPMTATIKTETGYNDCMLALDYAAQTKVHAASCRRTIVTICTATRRPWVLRVPLRRSLVRPYM